MGTADIIKRLEKKVELCQAEIKKLREEQEQEQEVIKQEASGMLMMCNALKPTILSTKHFDS